MVASSNFIIASLSNKGTEIFLYLLPYCLGLFILVNSTNSSNISLFAKFLEDE